ncbi:glycosyltransferase family 2 protein [Maliponia aquimaris]|uniref:Putative glycosyltransferase EpsJ n=1 Tax=Maliponia aquimaris TaxID=1673631 RepID=A0A238JQQ0_9RHOB|nr:glycosyltransferase family 2 protein [Maliponia aquimaris]SMX32885.1 putative glycosyltransferase EpsJ [Maliponia aquimaris]
MNPSTQAGGPQVSVIVPASNEAALIGGCLSALLMSAGLGDGAVEVFVVANGCRDETAAIARGFQAGYAARGWRLEVIERAEGSKPGALNAGDAAARGAVRVYLDADVTVAPALLGQLVQALDTGAPRYASGRVEIAAQSAVSRAYARVWRRVPFMRKVVPGCGLFAVNAAGRARWDTFPEIISDDIYVRLQFRPGERMGVPASYRWPIAEGWGNLVRVRRRQDAGVAEVAARFPELRPNDDKPAFALRDKLALALGDPLGFAVYAGVALAVRLTPRKRQDWSRGR